MYLVAISSRSMAQALKPLSTCCPKHTHSGMQLSVGVGVERHFLEASEETLFLC